MEEYKGSAYYMQPRIKQKISFTLFFFDLRAKTNTICETLREVV